MLKAKKTKETQGTKKLLLKYLSSIPVKNNNVDGKFKVTGYRKLFSENLTFRTDFNREEVDLEFSGKLFVFWDGKRQWVGSELLNKKNSRGLSASKIKINRMIRKAIIKDLTLHANYFSVNLGYYDSIKKFKWK